MNHQPYESWILESHNLTNKEQGELLQHLAGCKACQQLRDQWLGLRQEMISAPVVSPRPDFARRWQAGNVERRVREQRRQAWKLFLACSGSAATILLFLVGYFLATSTPSQWVQAAMRTITNTAGFITTVRGVATTWLQMTPFSLNLAVWILLTVTFCITTFIWVIAIWRTSIVGVMNK
jgi:hypothetical protein